MISCFSQLLKSLIACNFLSHGSEIKFINDEDAAHAKLEVQNRSLIIAEKKLGSCMALESRATTRRAAAIKLDTTTIVSPVVVT